MQRDLAEIIGESPAIEAVREKLRKVLALSRHGRRPIPVLLQGETGTGKGLVARTLHRHGPRADGPFIDINCAAIPEALLEAELFGYERGAFTDASRAKPGLFQSAHRGMLFLDEIALLPESLQAKLLTALEEGVVRRLGSTVGEPVDTWIASASNADLLELVEAHRFRRDLYERLAAFPVHLPPLRMRGRDVVQLARRFLTRVCADYGFAEKLLDPEACERLLRHRWPGNVRELSNVIERAAVLVEGPVIGADLLDLSDSGDARARADGPVAPAPRRHAGEAMRERLRTVLVETGWNISRSARLLGITRNTLRSRIRKLGLREDEVVVALASRPGLGGDREAPASGVPAPLRWHARHLALMRVAFVARSEVADAGRAIDVVIDKVHGFGGRIESLRRSEVEASFGVDPLEDAPRRAAHAALAIQRAGTRARGGGDDSLGFKVAIHAGVYMVGHAGTHARIDEDVKHAASRLMESLLSAADEDSVVVSASAAALLERRFEFVPIGAPDGQSGPPRRLLAGRERHGLGLGGRMAAFVGRNREMAMLQAALDSAIAGQGQLVSIIGDAGIGKSRLLFEFRRALAHPGIDWVEGHCLSHGASIPCLPVLDLVRARCGVTDEDGAVAIEDKVRRRLVAVGMDAGRHTPYVLSLLGLKHGADLLASLAPDAVKAHTFESVRQLFVASSRIEPLIIVVEDLHWVDRMSEDLLASLAGSVPRARMLFLATHRPACDPPWIGRPSSSRLLLTPLSHEDSLDLTRSLASRPLVEPLARAILDRAEGNPFFLEELSRSLEDGDPAAQSDVVPDTIQDVLMARIERLRDADQRLLRSAAVLGKDVPVSVLAAALELPDEALERGLDRLAASGFLEPAASAPERRYTFRHALTQEVAYATLESGERRRLHARIAERMEAMAGERLTERVESLGLHAFLGGNWSGALVHLREAGGRAMARGANREAVTLFERALVALSHLPSGPDRSAQAIDLRFDLRSALLPLGELARSLVYLNEAEALATALDDQARLGQLWVYLTSHWRLAGDNGLAWQYGRRALASAEARGDEGLAIAANTYLGQLAHASGDCAGAAARFRRNVDALDGDRMLERLGFPQLPSVHSRTCLVWSLVELGEFAEAITRGEEAVRIADSADQPLSRTVARAGLGMALTRRGDVTRAIPVLEQGLELIRQAGTVLWLPRMAGALGVAHALAGRASEGRILAGEAAERCGAAGLRSVQSLVVLWLGETELLGGDVDAAALAARRSLELARESGERGQVAWALRLLGEAALDRRDADLEDAAGHFAQSLALSWQLGMRPLAAHCHLGLGRVARRRGHDGAGTEHLRTALRLFTDLDMLRWSAQARAEIEGR